MKQDDGSTVQVNLLENNIAWPSDKEKKFENPPGALNSSGGNISEKFNRAEIWADNSKKLNNISLTLIHHQKVCKGQLSSTTCPGPLFSI